MMVVLKTTLGKIVAKKQDLQFIDTDLCVEKKWSMEISEIFKIRGEKFFREEEEKEVLKSLNKSNCVIALGGGAFINRVVRNSILKNSVSVWLSQNLGTLYKRAKWNKKRPLLKEVDIKKKIKEIYNKRKDIYKLADHKINCDNLSKESIVKKIIDIYEKY